MTGRQRLLQGRIAAGAADDPGRHPAVSRGLGLATATIGSTVAAKTLGEVIIAGLCPTISPSSCRAA